MKVGGFLNIMKQKSYNTRDPERYIGGIYSQDFIEYR